MGNSSPHQPSLLHSFHRKYSFLHLQEQEPFGTVALYRKKQQNYDYAILVPLSVSFPYFATLLQELYHLKQNCDWDQVLKLNHLMPIAPSSSEASSTNSSFCKKLSSSSQVGTVHVCMEYQPFTLDKHLSFKRKHRQELTLEEIAYVLRCCIKMCLFYQDSHFTCLEVDLSLKYVYISTDGLIKLLPFSSPLFELQEQSSCETGSSCQTKEPSKVKSQDKSESRLNTFKSKQTVRIEHLLQIKHISDQLFSTIQPNLSLNSKENVYIQDARRTDALTRLKVFVKKANSIQEILKILPSDSEGLLLNNFNPLSLKNLVNSSQNKGVDVRQPSLDETQEQTMDHHCDPQKTYETKERNKNLLTPFETHSQLPSHPSYQPSSYHMKQNGPSLSRQPFSMR